MITLEDAKSLQPGDVLTFGEDPQQYEVSSITFVPGGVRVNVDHDTHEAGLATFFTHEHLQIVNLAYTNGPREPFSTIVKNVGEAFAAGFVAAGQQAINSSAAAIIPTVRYNVEAIDGDSAWIALTTDDLAEAQQMIADGLPAYPDAVLQIFDTQAAQFLISESRGSRYSVRTAGIEQPYNEHRNTDDLDDAFAWAAELGANNPDVVYQVWDTAVDPAEIVTSNKNEPENDKTKFNRPKYKGKGK